MIRLFFLTVFLSVLSLSLAQTPKQKIIDRTFVDFQLEKSVQIGNYIYSIGTNNSSQETYSALVKQDLELNTIWLKYVYRGVFIPDKFQRLTHMVKTDDDHMIIAGANGTYMDAASWIMKVDTNGVIVWETDIKPNPFHESVFAIKNPQDGALIVNREPPGGPNNITLFNLDSNGDSLWTRRVTSLNSSSLVSREGYLRSDNHFVHFIHEGGRAGHIEVDENGNLLGYVKYEEQGTSRYLLVNAVYYETNGAYIAGRMSGSGAAIMKLDDNMNILWAKEYPELTAFTGLSKTASGEFIANGINTSGVYNSLATTVRLDANCDPIKGYAYGQIPGYHVIPFHMTEINNHYLLTGYRIEQGWTTSYQIFTDEELNSSSCYQRNFDVSAVSINLTGVSNTIGFEQLGYEINLYGPSSDPSGFYNASFSEFEIDQTINNSYDIIGDDCGGVCNGSIEVYSSGGSAPYSYEWSNGQVGSIANGLCSGEQLILLSGDQLGCFAYDTVDVPLLTPINEICLITVDSTSAMNEIVWEKPVSNSIEGFGVYREAASNYTLVGYVPYDSLSKFIDNTNGVNPNITSYRYKITTIDTCGYESELSDYHETIHLTVNQGVGGVTNLIWDNYEGFSFSYNRIWKDSIGDGNWRLKDSVSNTVFTWTDPYSATAQTIYRIEVVSPSICTSTRAIDHNSTRSNQSTISGPPIDLGMDENYNAADFIVFPNPAGNFFTLKLNHTEHANLSIYDLQGRIVKNIGLNSKTLIIEIPELNKGIYWLKVTCDDEVITKKLLKN